MARSQLWHTPLLALGWGGCKHLPHNNGAFHPKVLKEPLLLLHLLFQSIIMIFHQVLFSCWLKEEKKRLYPICHDVFFVEKMTHEYGEHVTRQKKVFVGFYLYLFIDFKAIIVCLRFRFKATQNVHPLLHKSCLTWFCELFFYLHQVQIPIVLKRVPT